nr:MAG TPA: Protein-arginine kinase [Caudoviricetes sp.]
MLKVGKLVFHRHYRSKIMSKIPDTIAKRITLSYGILSYSRLL